MAERVKRRVQAARLAVAFVAAGTIAGAAWAQAGAPPTAGSSASDYLLKIDSRNVINGSLLLEDFHKREVPSFTQFAKLKRSEARFNKATRASIDSIKGELGGIRSELGAVKGEIASDYVKLSDADTRYLKVSDDVVRGDGSVFTASQLVDLQAQSFVPLLDVPGMVSVEAMGAAIRIRNMSGGELGHSACGNTAGTLPANGTVQCFAGGSTESIQFFSWGREIAATVSFSSVPGDAGTAQDIVQILIGL
jgi:hypothetical protein